MSRRAHLLDARTTDDSICNLRGIVYNTLVPIAELSEHLMDAVFGLSDTISRLGDRTKNGCYPRTVERTDIVGRVPTDNIGQWECELVDLISRIRATELWMTQRGIRNDDSGKGLMKI